MNTTIGIVGKLFGLLQQDTGENMIDLIGPLNVYRGDSLALRLVVTDDEDAREDLTGATIELFVLTDAIYLAGTGEPTIAKTAEVDGGITLGNQLDEDEKGTADIEITSDDLNIATGLYWLGVVITLADSRQHVIAPREFTVDLPIGVPA